MIHRRKSDMPNEPVLQNYCDKQHETLDKRMDRLDSRIFWILTFTIIVSVGMLVNISLTLVNRSINLIQANAATLK